MKSEITVTQGAFYGSKILESDGRPIAVLVAPEWATLMALSPELLEAAKEVIADFEIAWNGGLTPSLQKLKAIVERATDE